MKKEKGSRTWKVITSIFNVRAWIDYDRIKAAWLYIKNGIKKLFIPQKKVKKADFNRVVEEMNLTEKDLISRQKALKRLSIFMVIVAFGIFTYAGYHLFSGNIRATVVSLVVMLIALTLAFRYHFWYFQIKERKLGCTFREWFRQGLMGEKE
ncbi:type IV secretion protein IcmV [Legionella israelensis]|uniref:Type IV secretion protein IcmV n=1 Tax=Legionella israelensis TaxID=454 RepID=A0AAX1EDY4_9GAMM|nr:type IVB secretion system protein IcmV [Legionella israelensis]QBR83300.1 type IV secretion protein IcmV [Legionella israelensis]QDP71829.1 type IV secretion protein IcmV [Legionella israelensis]